MALPKIELPTYEVRLPSSGKEITIRPFIVKEEKLLLMAAASKDEMDVVNTTKQVIRNCIMDEDVDIEKLPFFDIDFLFIALRAKSIGEKIEMQFVCNNTVEGDECKNVFYADIDISDATIDKRDDIESEIKLTEKLTMRMKYPTYSVMKMLDNNDNTIERKIKIIVNCVEYILDGDKMHSSKDYSKDELREFIENLTEEHFEKLSLFVENFPSFSIKTTATCPKCRFNHNLVYKDFSSFF